jgi:hypothetical protein
MIAVLVCFTLSCVHAFAPLQSVGALSRTVSAVWTTMLQLCAMADAAWLCVTLQAIIAHRSSMSSTAPDAETSEVASTDADSSQADGTYNTLHRSHNAHRYKLAQ